MAGKKRKRFSVESIIDRGENAKPRYYGGFCNAFKLTREDAEKIAAEERKKSYVHEVRIVEDGASAMKKLSDRAKVLLLIVNSKTRFDSDGKIASYFVPGSVNSLFYCEHLKDATSVSGGGDARALKSLEKAGLIVRPSTKFMNAYCFTTTEAGRAEVAKILESDWSYLKKKPSQD